MAELLRTHRLLVRDWSVADAEAALKLYGHDTVMSWLHEPNRIPNADAMHGVLHSWITEQREMSPGTGRWALVLLDGGMLVGGVSLLPMPVPEADVEIEYQLAPEYWGRGYGREAVRLILDYAFRVRNFRRVWLETHAANERAIRAYKACGFVEEGRMRQHVWLAGRFVDNIIMGVLREEWRTSLPGDG